jgi:hypothetical protein
MPATMKPNAVLSEAEINIRAQRAWNGRHYRPTLVLVGLQRWSSQRIKVPLVQYANAPSHSLILPQRRIEKDEDVRIAVQQLLLDGFESAPSLSGGPLVCSYAYMRQMKSGDMPPGFGKGKYYFFVEVELPPLPLMVKAHTDQSETNPIIDVKFIEGRQQTCTTLEAIPRASKKKASIAAVTSAFRRRLVYQAQAA